MHYCYAVSAVDLAVSVLDLTVSVVLLTVSCQHYCALLEQQTRSIIALNYYATLCIHCQAISASHCTQQSSELQHPVTIEAIHVFYICRTVTYRLH